MGLDGLGPKLNGPEDLGKRLRRKKRARVASPQPDSRSQSNSNGTPHKATVRHCLGVMTMSQVLDASNTVIFTIMLEVHMCAVHLAAFTCEHTVYVLRTQICLQTVA